MPKDIPFLGDKETEGAVPGVTSIVRLVVGYTEFQEMRIQALELMPKETIADVTGKEIEALRKVTDLQGEKSITTANWGGRPRDINGPDGKDMYTDQVSFMPGEWNDCGRRDEWGRQIMCKMDDFKAWSPVVFVTSLMMVAVGPVGTFILIVFVSWLAIRFLRGQKAGEVVAATGENDALLLFRDEELEEEEEKMRREVLPAQVCTGEHEDDGQFAS